MRDQIGYLCAIAMAYLRIFASFGYNYATPHRRNKGGVCRVWRRMRKQAFVYHYLCFSPARHCIL